MKGDDTIGSKLIIQNDSDLTDTRALRLVTTCINRSYPKLGFYPGVVDFLIEPETDAKTIRVFIFKNKHSIRYVLSTVNEKIEYPQSVTPTGRRRHYDFR
jgi:hypothetical protein